ncbi:MAG: serine hydrolase domain-containing protein [Pseudomonadota bacterium]
MRNLFQEFQLQTRGRGVRVFASAALVGCAVAGCGLPSSEVAVQSGRNASGSWPEIDERLQRAVRPAAPGVPCQGGYSAESCGLELRFGSRDQLWYDQSFGEWTRDAQVPIASASKWLTAAAIMTLVDEGTLDLDAPISTYWSGLDADHGAISMRQLLSHTSGMVHHAPCTHDQQIHTLQQCAQEILLLPLAAKPGTTFLYGAPSFQVAGAIAEKVSGQSWRDLFKERIADPLGMTKTLYGSTRGQFADTTSNPQLAGGGISTASDYYAFLDMMMQRGMFQGRRVLSERAYDAMERSNTGGVSRYECPLTEAACYPVWPTAGFALGNPATGSVPYGLGNWLFRVDSDCNGTLVSSPGAYGVHGWIDTIRGYRGLLFMNGDYTASAPIFEDLLSILDQRIPQRTAPEAPLKDCA